MNENGLVLIDKEEGMTSRFIDNQIGKLFLTRKVGHLGTLDPFATGLLIVGVRKGTKFFPYLPEGKKRYQATLVLGAKTLTGDKEGELLFKKEVPDLEKSTILRVFEGFLGKSLQKPPLYSAIKVDGKPLYKYARENKTVERKEREIEIYSLKLLSLEGNKISFEALVKKGTYIRVLGEDIAQKLGTYGYLESLRRLEDAGVSVSKAKRLSEITKEDILDPTPFLKLKTYSLSLEEWKDVFNGRKIRLSSNEERLLLLFEGKAVFIYKNIGDSLFEAERGFF